MSAISGSDAEVYLVIGALAAVGVVLLVLAGWLLKATRPERELLGPLERMGERSWRELDPAVQHRELDELRPPGARPIARADEASSTEVDGPQTVAVVTAGVQQAGQNDDTAEAAAPGADADGPATDDRHDDIEVADDVDGDVAATADDSASTNAEQPAGPDR